MILSVGCWMLDVGLNKRFRVVKKREKGQGAREF